MTLVSCLALRKLLFSKTKKASCMQHDKIRTVNGKASLVDRVPTSIMQTWCRYARLTEMKYECFKGHDPIGLQARANRQHHLRYDQRMKSNLSPETTPKQKVARRLGFPDSRAASTSMVSVFREPAAPPKKRMSAEDSSAAFWAAVFATNPGC